MRRTFDLPVHLQEQLLQLAEHLPEKARAGFLKRTAAALSDLTVEYKNTLVFAVVGWMLGELLDNLLSVRIPFTDFVFELTADQLSNLGLLTGMVYGLSKDKNEEATRRKVADKVADIVAQELRRALASA
ncbi:hypothetical protein [Thermopirellula anaerolimosa]